MIGLIKAIVYFAMGKRKLDAGDFPAAISFFGKVLAAKPNNYLALNNRGVAKQGTGDYRAAIDDFNEALRLNPRLAVTYYSRGISSKFLGQLDLATEDQRRALDIAPVYADALSELAALQFLKQEYLSAIDFSTLALEVLPDARVPLSARGLSNFALGNFKSSTADLRQAVNIHADPYDMLFLHLACIRIGETSLDELRANSNKLARAKWPAPLFDLFLTSLSIDEVSALAPDAPQRAETQFYAGQWHLQHENVDEAIKAFELAARGCPITFAERSVAMAELKALGRLR